MAQQLKAPAAETDDLKSVPQDGKRELTPECCPLIYTLTIKKKFNLKRFKSVEIIYYSAYL